MKQLGVDAPVMRAKFHRHSPTTETIKNLHFRAKDVGGKVK